MDLQRWAIAWKGRYSNFKENICLKKSSSKLFFGSCLVHSEWNQELAEAVKRRAPKLKRALFRTFSASILPQGILFFIAIVSKYEELAY